MADEKLVLVIPCETTCGDALVRRLNVLRNGVYFKSLVDHIPDVNIADAAESLTVENVKDAVGVVWFPYFYESQDFFDRLRRGGYNGQLILLYSPGPETTQNYTGPRFNVLDENLERKIIELFEKNGPNEI